MKIALDNNAKIVYYVIPIVALQQLLKRLNKMDEELFEFIESNVTEIDMDFQDMTEEDKAILIFRNSTY